MERVENKVSDTVSRPGSNRTCTHIRTAAQSTGYTSGNVLCDHMAVCGVPVVCPCFTGSRFLMIYM